MLCSNTTVNTDVANEPNLDWQEKLIFIFYHLHITCLDNPLYTDTRYNDKIRYNDNLTVTKPLLRWLQSLKLCKNFVFYTLKKHMFWIFVRIASVMRF